MKRIGRNGGDRGNGGESSSAATAPSASEQRGDHVDSRELLKVLTAFRRGDFSVRMSAERIGLEGRIADTLNDILQLNERMTREFERINKVVGKEGRSTNAPTSGSRPAVGACAWMRSMGWWAT